MSLVVGIHMGGLHGQVPIILHLRWVKLLRIPHYRQIHSNKVRYQAEEEWRIVRCQNWMVAADNLAQTLAHMCPLHCIHNLHDAEGHSLPAEAKDMLAIHHFPAVLAAVVPQTASDPNKPAPDFVEADVSVSTPIDDIHNTTLAAESNCQSRLQGDSSAIPS